MPQAKAKPSKIASEAKKIYTPYIQSQLPQFPPVSISYPDSSKFHLKPRAGCGHKLRVAVISGDPVDAALDWDEANSSNFKASGSSKQLGEIPVVNMANEKRAGGDWESGLIAPEECICRRSNLAKVLTTPSHSSAQLSHYPIRTTGGIYSPHVVIFRSGADKNYSMWKDWKVLPIISVAPIRRPRLDAYGANYSFDQERELMREKMRTVLRIAALWQYPNLCIGSFGVGFGFRNPAVQVASMWRELLFCEHEFQGAFSNIVFVLENASNGSSKSGLTDLEVFEREFDPGNVIRTSYR